MHTAYCDLFFRPSRKNSTTSAKNKCSDHVNFVESFTFNVFSISATKGEFFISRGRYCDKVLKNLLRSKN